MKKDGLFCLCLHVAIGGTSYKFRDASRSDPSLNSCGVDTTKHKLAALNCSLQASHLPNIATSGSNLQVHNMTSTPPSNEGSPDSKPINTLSQRLGDLNLVPHHSGNSLTESNGSEHTTSGESTDYATATDGDEVNDDDNDDNDDSTASQNDNVWAAVTATAAADYHSDFYSSDFYYTTNLGEDDDEDVNHMHMHMHMYRSNAPSPSSPSPSPFPSPSLGPSPGPPLEIFSEFPASLVKEFTQLCSPTGSSSFSSSCGALFNEIDRLLTCRDPFERTNPEYRFTADSTSREAFHVSESTLATLGFVAVRIEEIAEAFKHSRNVQDATRVRAITELGYWRGTVKFVVREIKRLRGAIPVPIPGTKRDLNRDQNQTLTRDMNRDKGGDKNQHKNKNRHKKNRNRNRNKNKLLWDWNLGKICRRLEMLERLAGLWKGLARRVSEQAAALERGRILYSYNTCVECGFAVDPAKTGVVEHEWRGLVDEALVTWKSALLVNDGYCSGCAGLEEEEEETDYE